MRTKLIVVAFVAGVVAFAGMPLAQAETPVVPARGNEPTISPMAVPPPQDPFCGFLDNPWDAYFSEASCWLFEQGVTNGTGLTTYGPSMNVTRAQMAAFLWKAAGSPEVPDHVFADEGSIPLWARTATDWLKAEGITTNDPYRPAANVTRAEMAAFLWRAEGQPSAVNHVFRDEASIPLWARPGTDWLKARNITTNDPYNPNGIVNRAQMAAFLWRVSGSPAMESLPDPSALVLWMNTNRGDLTVDVPLGSGNVTIDWGDGTQPLVTGGDQVVSHTYATRGYYRVVITGLLAEFGGYENSQLTSADELVAVSQFGNLGVTSLWYAFSKAPNLTRVTQNLPESVDSLEATFSNSIKPDPGVFSVSTASAIDGNFRNYDSLGPDIAEWDTSEITDMSWMFAFEDEFNVDISGWDTSNVTTMEYMFVGADSFNQDLSRWDVSNVTNMREMFHGAKAFQSDLNTWDVSNVTNMLQMFYSSNYDGNISNWNLSSLRTAVDMFAYATRTVDIANWTFPAGTTLEGMLKGADITGELVNWDVSGVVNMSLMFADSNFNQDLSGWDVANVTNKFLWNFNTPHWVLPKPALGSLF